MADQNQSADLPKEIASAIREAIVSGRLIVDERLPSETELSDEFGVSRPTVREALKRLAAQNLIRTKRGATGGAFVNRLSFEEARGDLITTSTLLLSMNEVDFDTACEARFTLERACAALSAQRRTADHLATMRAEITRQSQAGLSDESFCASDVAFHRAFVDAANNPVLSWQLAAAVEAIEPLMNIITYTQRDRKQVIDLHTEIANAVERHDGLAADRALQRLSSYTQDLARKAMAQRKAR